MTPVRTLIVDDSASIRAVLARILSSDPEIEVVGQAPEPHTAREMIKALEPDVITLDVEMPGMDGLSFLERIMRLRPMPVVMCSTLTARGAAVTIEALRLGAVDLAMKKLLIPLGVVLAGAGAGGGAAFATRHVIAAKAAAATAGEPLAFVPVAKVVAPLVLKSGGLAGYVAFDTELQVPEAAQADVTAKLPLLLHAINMRTYRTPLATGPDGMLPNIGELKSVVQAACAATFGASTVRRVAITRAEPI